MKKFILAIMITSLLFAFCAAPLTAVAEDGDFVKIEGEAVGFYRAVNQTMTLQFYLPADTYAKVIFDDQGEYYGISYNNISGYLRKSDVTKNSQVTIYKNVSNPYSATVITLKPDKKLYTSTDISSFSLHNPSNTLTYIGRTGIDTVWFAVKKNNEQSIYYVLEGDIFVPEPDPDPDPDPEPSNGGSEEPSNNLVKALLIIGIVIPALIIVFLLFKPKRRRPNSHRYMDDNPRRRHDDDYYYDDDYYE